MKDIKVSYGVHVDAVAGWLGSYGGEDSPDDISRGIFAAEVGAPRMLNLFGKWSTPVLEKPRSWDFRCLFRGCSQGFVVIHHGRGNIRMRF